MLEQLIALLFFVQSLIQPVTVEPTKQNLYQWRDDLNPAFVALGYAEIKDIQVTWEALPANIRAATGIPVWQYNPYCGRYIGMDVTYRYEYKPWYGTPEIVWVLAHEQAHVYQGVSCLSWYSEPQANIMALVVLLNTDGEVYEQAALWLLSELLLVRAVDESCMAGVDYHEWMSDLPDETLAVYGDIKCWQAKGFRGYTSILDEVLESDTVYGVDVQIIQDVLTTK